MKLNKYTKTIQGSEVITNGIYKKIVERQNITVS